MFLHLLYSLQQWRPGHKHFAIIHSLRSDTKHKKKARYTRLLQWLAWKIRWPTDQYVSHAYLDELIFFVFPFTVDWVLERDWTDSVRTLSRISLSWSWTCSMTFILIFYERKIFFILNHSLYFDNCATFVKLFPTFIHCWKKQWWNTSVHLSHCLASSSATLSWLPAAERRTDVSYIVC